MKIPNFSELKGISLAGLKVSALAVGLTIGGLAATPKELSAGQAELVNGAGCTLTTCSGCSTSYSKGGCDSGCSEGSCLAVNDACRHVCW